MPPDLVGVLAEPNRRRLLELLVFGEQSVSQLASQFGVTRSAVSQHLGVLADTGLVQARREGRFRYYRVIPGGMAALRDALDVFWTKELEQLAAVRPAIKGEGPMSVEKSIVVPLDADETFALLTQPERLRRWQAVTARLDLRAGGEYRWTIVPGHTAAGEIASIEPGKRVVFTWGWEDSEDLPPGASTVTITLEPTQGGTLVRLIHEGLTPDQVTGHSAGWDHYLERLAVAGRTGDAGADDWASAPEPLDQLSAAEASLAACQLVLRGLKPGDGGSPSPCKNFNVDEVVDHLIGSIAHLGAAAGGSITSSTEGKAETRVANAAQEALEAWRRRGLEGSVKLGPGEMPARLAANIFSVEFLVHAWDVAQASSQSLEASDVLTGYVLELARELIAPPMRDGDRFAAEVQVGLDDDNLQRLIAFTGRTV